MKESDTQCQDEIRNALRAMRRRRLKIHLRLLGLAISFVVIARMLLGFAPLVGIIVSCILGVALGGVTLYAFGVVRGALCPVCHRPFCFRTYESGFYFFNDFTTYCLNCGVKQDGSNIQAILQQNGGRR
jgi:hypothetical protein